MDQALLVTMRFVLRVDPQNALGAGAVRVGVRRAADDSGRSEAMSGRSEDDRIMQRHANVATGGRTIVVRNKA